MDTPRHDATGASRLPRSGARTVHRLERGPRQEARNMGHHRPLSLPRHPVGEHGPRLRGTHDVLSH